MKKIGSRIKLVRADLGITQMEFSKNIGVSNNYLSELEAEKKVPSEPLLLAIEYKFGVRKEWLLNGKGEKYVREKLPITKKEGDLIKAIRELPNEGKKAVIGLIELLSKQKTQKD